MKQARRFHGRRVLHAHRPRGLLQTRPGKCAWQAPPPLHEGAAAAPGGRVLQRPRSAARGGCVVMGRTRARTVSAAPAPRPRPPPAGGSAPPTQPLSPTRSPLTRGHGAGSRPAASAGRRVGWGGESGDRFAGGDRFGGPTAHGRPSESTRLGGLGAGRKIAPGLPGPESRSAKPANCCHRSHGLWSRWVTGLGAKAKQQWHCCHGSGHRPHRNRLISPTMRNQLSNNLGVQFVWVQALQDSPHALFRKRIDEITQ
jgi:hypothetical protein